VPDLANPIASNARMRIVITAIALLILAGCRYYYTKPTAGYADFAGDHSACVTQVGRPSASGEHVYVGANEYRGCMQLRGWQRTEKSNPGREWFRGIEEDGVYRADTLPGNRDTAETLMLQREHCRQVTRGRGTDAYVACLSR
jgi:hypothetical protein